MKKILTDNFIQIIKQKIIHLIKKLSIQKKII